MVNALDNITKYFDLQMVLPLQQVLIARKLVPLNMELYNKGRGMKTVDYWTLNDMSAAQINYEIPEHGGEAVDVTSNTVKVLNIKESYKIARLAFESFGLKGLNVDSAVSMRSAYQVALKEDALLLDGWKPDGSTYKEKGLYQMATNTEGTSLDFGTFGNAISKVAKSIALLEADKIYGPYNMVLNPTQKNELLGSVSTTGFPELPVVRQMLKQGPTGQVDDVAGTGGKVFSTPLITAGTGMILAAPNQTYSDVIVAQDYRNNLNIDPKEGNDSPIYGSVGESIALRVKFPDSICTITGI